MNFKKLITIASFVLPVIAFAQQEIKIEEVEKEMSMGTKNCYILNIPQTKVKDVTEDWKKFIKKDSKGKVEDIKGEIQLIGAVNKNVSSFPFNIFSRLLETQNGVQLSVWASEGDIFISTKVSQDKSVAVQKYLHDFAVVSYKDAVKNELSSEQDKLKDVQKIFDGFLKDQKKAEDNIEDDKKQIEKLQKDIKNEETNIAKAKDNQVKQKSIVDTQTNSIKTVSDKMNNIK